MHEITKQWVVENISQPDKKDISDLKVFFSENFPEISKAIDSPYFFSWKLGEANPAGQGYLLVAKHQGKIVGLASGTKKEIKFRGKIIRALEVGDTFTSLEFRQSGKPETLHNSSSNLSAYVNVSIFGRLITEILELAVRDGVELAYGTPNYLSLRPYTTKLGFSLQSKPQFVIYTLPLNLEKLNCFAILRLFLRFYQLSTMLFDCIVMRQISVKKFSCDGDQLLSSYEKAHLGDAQLAMSKQYLSFRFLQNASTNYFTIEISNKKNNEILGFCIVRIRIALEGTKTMIVCKSSLPSNVLFFVLVKRVAIDLFDCDKVEFVVKQSSISSINRILSGYPRKGRFFPIILKVLSGNSDLNSFQFTTFELGDCDLG